MTKADSSRSASRTFTEEEIKRKVSDGVTKLIIIDNTVYDLTNYVNRCDQIIEAFAVFSHLYYLTFMHISYFTAIRVVVLLFSE